MQNLMGGSIDHDCSCCRCPECAHGSVDMANDGNGRWQGEWFAVPCNVGNTKFNYKIVVSSYYWFSMVISNTR